MSCVSLAARALQYRGEAQSSGAEPRADVPQWAVCVTEKFTSAGPDPAAAASLCLFRGPLSYLWAGAVPSKRLTLATFIREGTFLNLILVVME